MIGQLKRQREKNQKCSPNCYSQKALCAKSKFSLSTSYKNQEDVLVVTPLVYASKIRPACASCSQLTHQCQPLVTSAWLKKCAQVLHARTLTPCLSLYHGWIEETLIWLFKTDIKIKNKCLAEFWSWLSPGSQFVRSVAVHPVLQGLLIEPKDLANSMYTTNSAS